MYLGGRKAVYNACFVDHFLLCVMCITEGIRLSNEFRRNCFVIKTKQKNIRKTENTTLQFLLTSTYLSTSIHLCMHDNWNNSFAIIILCSSIRLQLGKSNISNYSCMPSLQWWFDYLGAWVRNHIPLFYIDVITYPYPIPDTESANLH